MPRSPARARSPHALLVVLLLAIAGPWGHRAVAGEAQRYALDPVHTRVAFMISHAGFSNAIGTVSGSQGELQFDPEDWSTARLRVRVPIGAIDMGDAEWTRATLARNLLDAERFPQAEFVSTRIEPIDAQHATVHGVLTLHGTSRDITMQVTLNALKRHPLPPFRRTAGFSATATISRADFGITAWKSVIGDTVELRIEAEAIRDNSMHGDDAPATDNADDAIATPPQAPAVEDKEPTP